MSRTEAREGEIAKAMWFALHPRNVQSEAGWRANAAEWTEAAAAALGAAAPQTAEPKARAVALAQRFHETYERLAPIYGYETRRESAKPWAEVPEQNRRLMVAVCAEVLAAAPVEEARQAMEAVAGRPVDTASARAFLESYDTPAAAPVPAGARERELMDALAKLLYVVKYGKELPAGTLEKATAYADEVFHKHVGDHVPLVAPSSDPAVPAGEPQATLGRLREAVAALAVSPHGRQWRCSDVLALIDAEQMRAVVPDTEDAR